MAALTPRCFGSTRLGHMSVLKPPFSACRAVSRAQMRSEAMMSQPKRAASSGNAFLLSKHGDFKAIEATRQSFDHSLPIITTKTPSPEWKYGDGVNDTTDNTSKHTEIDPYASDRHFVSNYKLLISGIPRPISFISTISTTGTKNLAPFSYFQVVDHDPPIFVVGFSGRKARLKDTRRNLLDTGECVINIVSEHMIEAVNGTSLELPKQVSEWELSGLRAAPSATVAPQRVKDAVFSIEAKLLEMKPLSYGKHDNDISHGALAILQGTRFWVRNDAINDTLDEVALEKLKPLVQLGGISYGRINHTFELPRPGLDAELENESKGLRAFVEPQLSAESTLHSPRQEAPEVLIKMASRA